MSGNAWLVLGGEDGRVIARRVTRADTFRQRLRGLLGRRGLSLEEGLLLTPCHAIHTFFMRFPIDILFLDADGRVVAAVQDLPPWRFKAAPGARAVLELPAGTVARTGVREGERITFVGGKH